MKTLKMIFKNEDGNNVTFSLKNPKDTLTAQGVKDAMDNIIAKNVFITTGGELVSKVRAEIVDTTETTLFDEEA